MPLNLKPASKVDADLTTLDAGPASLGAGPASVDGTFSGTFFGTAVSVSLS